MSHLSTSLAAAFAAALVMAAPLAQAAPGVQIVKDPVSGELRAPTQDELKAIAAQQGNAMAATPARRGMFSGTANPQQVRRANGAVSLELDESTMMYSVARRNPDGSITMECVTGADAAADAMKGGKLDFRTVTTSTKEQAREVK